MDTLTLLVLLTVALALSATLWCLFSTCLGPPLMRLARLWWEGALETARRQDVRNGRQSWDGTGEDWEMERLGRRF